METKELEKSMSLMVLNDEYGRYNLIGKAILKFWSSENINFQILGQEKYFDWTGRISKIWIDSGYIHWFTNEDEYSLYFGDHLEIEKELGEFFNKFQNNTSEEIKLDSFQFYSFDKSDNCFGNNISSKENLSEDSITFYECQNPAGLPESSKCHTKQIINDSLKHKIYKELKCERIKVYPVLQRINLAKRNLFNYRSRILIYKKRISPDRTLNNKSAVLRQRKCPMWIRHYVFLSYKPKITALNINGRSSYKYNISLSKKNNDCIKFEKKVNESVTIQPQKKMKNICLCISSMTMLISLLFAYIIFNCCELEYIPDELRN